MSATSGYVKLYRCVVMSRDEGRVYHCTWENSREEAWGKLLTDGAKHLWERKRIEIRTHVKLVDHRYLSDILHRCVPGDDGKFEWIELH